MSSGPFVIVGGGLAGAKAAESLRDRGFDGPILLIGDEAERPYERPPLTKEYLRGESERDAARVHASGFYEANEIELMTGTTVGAIDPVRASVTTDGGRELGYERLLLATGAEPRRLSLPGSELDGVHYLRTMEDCDALRARLAGGGRVAVVGAGWIGSEFAASARQLGLDVTVIDPRALPNERIFGPEIGAFFHDLHADHGVELALSETVTGFEGDGRLHGVRTGSGRLVECDFAVVGIGVVPRTALASAAGIATDNGVLVDDRLEASAQGVFAAGDIACAWHPFYRRYIRIEHWANALNQGPAAAAGMLGEDLAYDRIPYFFSDQYDVGIEYSGYATSWDEVVFRGDPADRAFIAFWLSEERVVAGMNVNIWDVNEHVQTLIRSRAPVDAGALADPEVALERLIDHARR